MEYTLGKINFKKFKINYVQIIGIKKDDFLLFLLKLISTCWKKFRNIFIKKSNRLIYFTDNKEMKYKLAVVYPPSICRIRLYKFNIIFYILKASKLRKKSIFLNLQSKMVP